MNGRSPAKGDELASRLALSAQCTEGVAMSTPGFLKWLAERRTRQAQTVERITFEGLDQWGFDAGGGELRHLTGRFFSVRGIRVRSDSGPASVWEQPIISQPEVGILGIAMREIDGVLHCLVQAKAEPGNINGVQLSPTVQATRSNYTRVHGGSPVPYLDEFRHAEPGRILADVLQSEQGSWFHHKRNRNMVIEVGPEIEAGENHCWLTLGQLGILLRHDNLVNMDTRTVLSCLPEWRRAGSPPPLPSRHTTRELLSWVSRQRSTREVITTPLPLRGLADWRISDDAISHRSGRYFSVVPVRVSSLSREVPAWSQPLLEPHGQGLAALLVSFINGVPHALLHARAEPGFLQTVELGPTVQYTPENYAHLPREAQPPLLDLATDRSTEPLYDTVLSEEGGRFLNALCRYVILEVDEDATTGSAHGGEDFRWLAVHQIAELLAHSHYLNVQARTLVAALRTLEGWA